MVGTQSSVETVTIEPADDPDYKYRVTYETADGREFTELTDDVKLGGSAVSQGNVTLHDPDGNIVVRPPGPNADTGTVHIEP